MTVQIELVGNVEAERFHVPGRSVHGGSGSNVRRGVVVSERRVSEDGRVDAVGRQNRVFRIDVCGRKAVVAPLLVARDHGPADRVEPTEQIFGVAQSSVADRVTDRAGNVAAQEKRVTVR